MTPLDHAEVIGIPEAIRLASNPRVLEAAPVEAQQTRPAPATIDEVRARLAARGLLRTDAAPVALQEPRVEGLIRFATVLDEAPVPEREAPEDLWDVVPEGSGTSRVRCPQCRDSRVWPNDVTRFCCDDCQRAWRWAVCERCDNLALTVERQESWHCACGHFNRSGWRTATARRDALPVVARRRHVAIEADRARVRAGIRRRRWKIIVAGIAGLIAALSFVLVVRTAEPTQASDTATTCGHFGRLRTEMATNSLGVAQVEAEVKRLKGESVGASPSVQKGVVDLAAAGKPGTATFLVAQTALADACESVN